MKIGHWDLTAVLHQVFIPKLLAALFSILILWQLWHILSYSYEPKTDAAAPMLIKTSIHSAQLDHADLLLFGQYIPQNTQGMEIKESTLDVKIVGIMYAQDPALSQVVLQSNGEEKVYVVGGKLYGGAVIKKIEADSIVILYHGRLERIALPKTALPVDQPHPLQFEE